MKKTAKVPKHLQDDMPRCAREGCHHTEKMHRPEKGSKATPCRSCNCRKYLDGKYKRPQNKKSPTGGVAIETSHLEGTTWEKDQAKRNPTHRKIYEELTGKKLPKETTKAGKPETCPECEAKTPNPQDLGELVCSGCGETFYIDAEVPDAAERSTENYYQDMLDKAKEPKTIALGSGGSQLIISEVVPGNMRAKVLNMAIRSGIVKKGSKFNDLVFKIWQDVFRDPIENTTGRESNNVTVMKMTTDKKTSSAPGKLDKREWTRTLPEIKASNMTEFAKAVVKYVNENKSLHPMERLILARKIVIKHKKNQVHWIAVTNALLSKKDLPLVKNGLANLDYGETYHKDSTILNNFFSDSKKDMFGKGRKAPNIFSDKYDPDATQYGVTFIRAELPGHGTFIVGCVSDLFADKDSVKDKIETESDHFIEYERDDYPLLKDTDAGIKIDSYHTTDPKEICEVEITKQWQACTTAAGKLWKSLNEQKATELRATTPQLSEPEEVYAHVLKIYEECRAKKRKDDFSTLVEYWLETQPKGTEDKLVKYAYGLGWGRGTYGQPRLYNVLEGMSKSRDPAKGPLTVEIDLEGVRPGKHEEHGVSYIYNPSNKNNPVRIERQPESTKVSFKLPEKKKKGAKGADALAALALPALSEVTKVKGIEDLVEKSDEKVSEKEKKKALEAYEHHSVEFKKLYPIYAKVEGGTINLFMEMIQDLLNTGEYTKTSAIEKVAADHKGIRGFSKATLYRKTAPALKRKWTRQPLPEAPAQDGKALYESVIKIRDQLISENKSIADFREALVDALPIGTRDAFMDYTASLGVCAKDTDMIDAVFTIWQNGIKESEQKSGAEQPSADVRKIMINVDQDDDPGTYDDSSGVRFKLSTRTGLDRIGEVISSPDGVTVTAIMWKGQNILKGAIPDIPSISDIPEEKATESRNETLDDTAVTGKIGGVLHTFTLDTLMVSEPETMEDAKAMIAQFRHTLLPSYKNAKPGHKVFETYKNELQLMQEIDTDKEVIKTMSTALESSRAENRRINSEKQELLSRLGEVERQNRELQAKLAATNSESSQAETP